MSEQPTGLEGITRRIKNLRSFNHERQQESKNIATAREALLLFSAQENQEPLSTYSADSESVFELDKQKPGTILRLNADCTPSTSGARVPIYFWFVVGSNDGGNISIYSPSSKAFRHLPPDSNPYAN